MRVPVIDSAGKQLMPCTPPKARHQLATSLGGYLEGRVMSQKIEQEWLTQNGFQKVHFNPKFNGGFFRFYWSPEESPNEIVVSFGEGERYERDGFMVWISAGMIILPVPYARTPEDLAQLARLLFGKTVGEITTAALAAESRQLLAWSKLMYRVASNLDNEAEAQDMLRGCLANAPAAVRQ